MYVYVYMYTYCICYMHTHTHIYIYIYIYTRIASLREDAYIERAKNNIMFGPERIGRRKDLGHAERHLA